MSQKLLCYYTAHLAKQGLTAATINTYLSALRHLQISKDLPEPPRANMPKLKTVHNGIKRVEAAAPKERKIRLPITPTLLRQIKQLWSPKAREYDTVMLWAASTLCFFGFFRMGELTVPGDQSYDPSVHLSVGDIAVDSHTSPSMLRVHLKISKTDQFRKGTDIYVGKTECQLCPVSAVLSYLVLRGNSPGPVFRFSDGKPLTKDRFTQRIREALSNTGIDASKYAGHSFRIGAATTAANCGLEDSLIQTLGRWHSSSYLTYIRIPREKLSCITKTLSTA